MNAPMKMLETSVRTHLPTDLRLDLHRAVSIESAFTLVSAGICLPTQEIADQLLLATGSTEAALLHINASHDAANQLLASLALAVRTSSTPNKV